MKKSCDVEQAFKQIEKAVQPFPTRKHWINTNRLLVPFGKPICTGNLPKWSTCPVLEMCQQVGVKEHR